MGTAIPDCKGFRSKVNGKPFEAFLMMSSFGVGVHPSLYARFKLLHPDSEDLLGVAINLLDTWDLVAVLLWVFTVMGVIIVWVIFIRVRVKVGALGPRPVHSGAGPGTIL